MSPSCPGLDDDVLDGDDGDDLLAPTPQPTSSRHFAGTAPTYVYASPATTVVRRLSGPRLPPVTITSPLELAHDTFGSRPPSVASTASRRLHPPPVMTGPAPDRAFSRQLRPSRTAPHYNGSSSDDDGDRRPSSGLMPRSALANYFNLDFSFLDDEPPPRKTAYGRRTQEARWADRPTSAPRARDPRGDEDYFNMKRLSSSLPASKRDSVGSTTSRLPFPSTNLPFPSRRPGNPRRISSDSMSSRRSSVLSPGERPFLPSHLSSSEGRRPSIGSSYAGSTGSGASSFAYASRRSPTSPTFPPIPEAGPDAAEKRKRLAAFLDETASAMEGGKSLMMVVPELQPAAPQPKSLAELAEEQLNAQRSLSQSLPGEIGYRYSFDARSTPAQPSSSEDDARSPTALSKQVFLVAAAEPVSPTLSAPEVQVQAPPPRQPGGRETVYYSPNSASHDAASASESEMDGVTFAQALADERKPAGLGFSIFELKASAGHPISERSLSTVRADSPAPRAHASPVPRSNDLEQEADTELKGLEKRRKIIRELVETETSYAIDMAVVRDIYLARARGAHMAQIADHVMSTGLGLGNVGSASPPSPSMSSRRASYLPESKRRVSDNGASRRASSGPFASGKPDQRRPAVVPALPTLMPGQPLMAEKDLHVIFANLEEIAAFAEGFANALDAAAGSDDPDEVDDRIGEIFVDLIPRIQQVYSTYCVRHHRAILRLQELEPTLRTYFSECKTLSHGRTNAWDLASLLIKPVQRCLKYPLLLDQILAVTPETHPDRIALQRANAEMLMVAEHINEVKKKQDAVNRVVNKEKPAQRRDSSRSISSSVTKKLLRSSQKAKTAFGFAENGGDEMFDTLVALVDSTRSGVLRFSNEMRDWTKSTKAALEAQVSMVEGWITMYAPMAGESHSAASASHRRLCIFLDDVLIPIIEGPWRELDHEVRRSLILKTDHLLSLFESPRQVITKRNDKMLDHSRYLAKKIPADRRGSEEFLLLSSQLLEELPRFLGSVSRYFNIIVGHFAGAQAAYHEAVQERWSEFAEQWLVQVENGGYEDIEASFASHHQPINQMMDTLAAGLGLAVAQSSFPLSRQRSSRLSHLSSVSSPPSSGHASSQSVTPEERTVRRQSYISAGTDYSSEHYHRGSLGSMHRSSDTSDSSAPSLRPSSADGSGSPREPITPPPMQPQFPGSVKGAHDGSESSRTVVHEPLSGHDRRSMAVRCDQALPAPPSRKAHGAVPVSSCATPARDMRAPSLRMQEPTPRPRSENAGRTAKELREKYLSTYSVYLPSAEEAYEDDEELTDGPLYIAEAVNASRSSAFRSGYPVLSFDVGERFYVELEEADRVEGGSGWLLGRKMEGDNALGWARTEDFVMVDESGEGEAESP
ncbi:hypothetical protein JCM3770_001883 [Rhodotorula araucariae]